jgi:hypothetical protein
VLKTIADQCDNKNYEKALKNVRETLESIKEINHDQLSPELIPIVEQLKIYIVGLEHSILNEK